MPRRGRAETRSLARDLGSEISGPFRSTHLSAFTGRSVPHLGREGRSSHGDGRDRGKGPRMSSEGDVEMDATSKDGLRKQGSRLARIATRTSRSTSGMPLDPVPRWLDRSTAGAFWLSVDPADSETSPLPWPAWLAPVGSIAHLTGVPHRPAPIGRLVRRRRESPGPGSTGEYFSED